SQNVCARIERRQRDLAVVHHREPRLDVCESPRQPVLPAAEREVNRAVFFLRDFNTQRSPTSFGFFNHLFWDKVMMNIDRAVAHPFSPFPTRALRPSSFVVPLLPNACCLLPRSKCAALFQLDEITPIDHVLWFDRFRARVEGSDFIERSL